MIIKAPAIVLKDVKATILPKTWRDRFCISPKKRFRVRLEETPVKEETTTENGLSPEKLDQIFKEISKPLSQGRSTAEIMQSLRNPL